MGLFVAIKVTFGDIIYYTLFIKKFHKILCIGDLFLSLIARNFTKF